MPPQPNPTLTAWIAVAALTLAVPALTLAVWLFYLACTAFSLRLDRLDKTTHNLQQRLNVVESNLKGWSVKTWVSSMEAPADLLLPNIDCHVQRFTSTQNPQPDADEHIVTGRKP